MDMGLGGGRRTAAILFPFWPGEERLSRLLEPILFPPSFRSALPQPDNPIDVLGLAAKVLQARHELTAMVLRMHGYLHQRLGHGNNARWLREPGNLHAAGERLGIE